MQLTPLPGFVPPEKPLLCAALPPRGADGSGEGSGFAGGATGRCGVGVGGGGGGERGREKNAVAALGQILGSNKWRFQDEMKVP